MIKDGVDHIHIVESNPQRFVEALLKAGAEGWKVGTDVEYEVQLSLYSPTASVWLWREKEGAVTPKQDEADKTPQQRGRTKKGS